MEQEMKADLLQGIIFVKGGGTAVRTPVLRYKKIQVILADDANRINSASLLKALTKPRPYI